MFVSIHHGTMLYARDRPATPSKEFSMQPMRSFQNNSAFSEHGVEAT
jgi:hypothetical protein